MVSQTYAQYVALPRDKRDYMVSGTLAEDRLQLMAWLFKQALAASGELYLCDQCDQPVSHADTALCDRCAWLPGVTE